MEELQFLMDKDVKTLCHNIKQTGGAAAGGVAGANLGHNIKLVSFWLQCLECISCTHESPVITVAIAHSIWALHDAEENYDDLTNPMINGWH